LSISTFREKFVSGGCGKVILIFAAAAMGLSAVVSSCNRGEKIEFLDAQGKAQKTVATVGNVPIPQEALEEAIKQSTAQYAQYMDQLPVEYQAGMYGQALQGVIKSGYGFELGQKEGVDTSEKSVIAAVLAPDEKGFRVKIREQLLTAKLIKENATEAEVDEAVKKAQATDPQTGQPNPSPKTIADIYKEQVSKISEIYKDPAKKDKFRVGVAQFLVIEKYKKDIKPTDEELKKSFDSYEVKRILLAVNPKQTEDAAKAKSQTVYAEIKAGKSFEDAMDQHSDDAAQVNKKKRDATTNLNPKMLEMPDFASVKSLKPGTYGEPVKVREGYAIYKLAGMKSNLPPDFDKTKDAIRKQFIDQEAQKKYNDKVEEIAKDNPPKFDVKGYEALYAFVKASEEAAKNPGKDPVAGMAAVVEIAKQVKLGDPADKVATMVLVAASQKLYEAPGADKAKMRPDYVGALEKYLTFSENWEFRKTIVDSYKDAKDGTKAYETLVAGLDKNTKYDAQGQSVFSNIAGKFAELKAAGLVKPEQEKEFQGKQTQWQSEKTNYDKQAAEAKKQQEAEAKKAAEEQKKAASSAPKPKK
jgi:parvulin-like peptidyl-prolyl isomerase